MQNNIFILGINSDIGFRLAHEFNAEGEKVFGTYRQDDFPISVSDISGLTLFHCDITDKKSIHSTKEKFKELASPWDTFISCIGTMEPIGSFFECDYDDWENSVTINSLAQLRFLHNLYPLRQKKKISNVVFFAGGGTNNSFKNYSAYCISKIMLIKMCELIDDEYGDINVFIIGPGWVRTKMHNQTFRNSLSAGENYKKTVEFFNSSSEGTSSDDIYHCIKWCIAQGKSIAGGRNFSVVHDHWNDASMDLAEQLQRDDHMYKLRRYKNDFKKGLKE